MAHVSEPKGFGAEFRILPALCTEKRAGFELPSSQALGQALLCAQFLNTRTYLMY
jgi:hypothetical protein